jgi:hypothetical protein
MTPVLFIFLDGVGIGDRDPARNPFFAAELPTLSGLLDGGLPSLGEPVVEAAGSRPAVAFPLDACLGVPGLPQSGTGQASLLTGENAAVLFGRHFGPWVPVALRPLVRDGSLLRTARAAGRSVAFGNAYPRRWQQGQRLRRIAAPPLAALGAELLTRGQEELARGEAVSSEIVNDTWQAHWPEARIPSVTAREAGATLGRMARSHDLTFYAHYATDTAGHRGDAAACVSALERVDGFLAGVLDTLPPDHLLLVASDHGNIEELGAGHTRNPALGLLAGPAAPARARELASLVDVAGAVSRWIAVAS